MGMATFQAVALYVLSVILVIAALYFTKLHQSTHLIKEIIKPVFEVQNATKAHISNSWPRLYIFQAKKQTKRNITLINPI